MHSELEIQRFFLFESFRSLILSGSVYRSTGIQQAFGERFLVRSAESVKLSAWLHVGRPEANIYLYSILNGIFSIVFVMKHDK